MPVRNKAEAGLEGRTRGVGHLLGNALVRSFADFRGHRFQFLSRLALKLFELNELLRIEIGKVQARVEHAGARYLWQPGHDILHQRVNQSWRGLEYESFRRGD